MRYFNAATEALFPFRNPDPVHVFLDLWGVLLDSDRMQREYGPELGRQMAERFGGEPGRWIKAHTAAWTAYGGEVERTEWSQGSWSATVGALDARFALRILELAGVDWRPADAGAFSQELDRMVMSRINAGFPDARAAVERLRAAGHRVYVATQASEANARGAMAGAGLTDALDGLFSGTSQDAAKSNRAYWTRIRSSLGVSEADGIVVDDRLDYLEAAASAGFRGLLLDREGIFDAQNVPHHVEAVLRNLAGLPHFVDTLASAASRP